MCWHRLELKKINFKRETPTAYFQETRIECHDRNAGIANNDITMKSESLEACCSNCRNKKVLAHLNAIIIVVKSV